MRARLGIDRWDRRRSLVDFDREAPGGRPATDTVALDYTVFEQGICVELNGKALSRFETLVEANRVAGRNGLGISNALENRIIGTKSRGVYEAPGMDLLGAGLQAVYQAVLDRRATTLFRHLSTIVAEAVYDGRLFDPAPRAAISAINLMAENATGTVELGLYKGSLFFQQLSDVGASLYNPADASMEASDGLNPVSSQGYVEVQAVEAIAMARAGQIIAPAWEL